MTPVELEQRLEALPHQPGVYLMKDRAGRVIYVGKAVNLASRVRSYFNPGSSDTRAFVALLDRLLGAIETVVVTSEKEALLLENELIKQHRPRFNVQWRDDKQFLCLRLSNEHRYPRLEMVRRPRRDGARYFGPYASASSIRETVRVVNRFFQLRTCSDHVLESRKRPCLLHQIGRCPAPCVKPIPVEEYGGNVDAVALFLEGRTGPLLENLRGRMKSASSKLEFEEAARLRDQVIAIERSVERQAIASTEAIDQDVFGLFREGDRITLYSLFVRGGRITGGQAHHFQSEFPDDELVSSFVNQYYADDAFVPKEVLLPGSPTTPEALAELLSERKGERVRVLVPERGEKMALLKLASKNAERSFSERKRSHDEVEQTLERLKEKLHLSKLPRRMECFDISHFQGAALVASKVASVDTEPDPSRYRHYKLEAVIGNDDFASMHEVLTRRLQRGLEDDDLPDLIVIDGGKGQLASAAAAMRDLGVQGVDLVSLAKSRDLDSPSPDALADKSPERVFLVGRKAPIVLPQTSPELFALTRLRDEAHRFAITYQRKLNRKRGLSSALDQVPGVGATRRASLLRHFGSIRRLREASIEELAEVDGIGPAVAERLHAFLHTPRPRAAPDDDQPDDLVREASLTDASER
ncbi:MAG: excinuclease ABC subunit UvrC [Myxococcaceae bacterium]|jgi:excinuclease ABC subunit C|nr:excinuclease ABC subunit UvrC [Myxococcaceae bacterium]MCA3014114.1 excinuclease ABC subunit UvrC [Myxococcaceae bacterium]